MSDKTHTPKWDLNTFIRDGNIATQIIKDGNALGRWIMDTRSEQVMTALIRLGWTPPSTVSEEDAEKLKRWLEAAREKKESAVINCVTVKAMIEMLSNWPATRKDGDPAIVWLETGNKLSSPCVKVLSVGEDLQLCPDPSTWKPNEPNTAPKDN